MSKKIDIRIIQFVKENLKTDKIIEEMIFQDGYQIYYNGGYVGNIKHLYS